ncbi:OmpA family protein [Emcibacter sp.]|uniref:OmpA family protein n=1 Tax=Emcibacter sp. TaxID=1979954 RepID=UPI002AA601A2|nr:OmpA family protein [Emcibacter sp.]
MLKKILAVSVCSAALLTTTVQAEDGNWYTGLEAGYSLLGAEKSTGASSGLNIRNEFKDGPAIGAVLGYDYGMLRLEGELGFHRHSLDHLVVTNAGGTGAASGSASGNSGLTTLMGNFVVDVLDRKDGAVIEPFIGAGLGFGRLNWSNIAYVADKKTSFAYQAFAGVRVPATDSLDVVAKYRYLATDDIGLTSSAGSNFKAGYDAHDFMIGLYYSFGGSKKSAATEMPQPVQVAAVEPAPVYEPAPEPEVVPVPDPMPEPAAGPMFDKGPFIVYFAFDSSDLDGAGRAKVAEAAAEVKKAGEVVIMVDGYTDKAGTDAYNDKLSAKRAEAVKKALEAEGLPAKMVVLASHGECDCEVETADGVKEPRNRRATIVLK